MAAQNGMVDHLWSKGICFRWVKEKKLFVHAPPSLLERVRKSNGVATKGPRIRTGRTPAENAEGADVDWEGGNAVTSEWFPATALVC